MIELIIAVSILIAVLLVVIYIQRLRTNVLEKENEIMKQTIKAADEALHQRIKIEKATFKVQRELKQKQREEQAKIDQGDRSQFDTDSL